MMSNAAPTELETALKQKEAGHEEHHYVNRSGWLRAAVLGANDGLLSTGSLMAGVAAASVGPGQLVMTGVAAIVAGALSMAVGEYVSVSSQADSEAADLKREQRALARDPEGEKRELAEIYRKRGLDPVLSRRVAEELQSTDALAAHARDELGITKQNTPRPHSAALASALSFIAGGLPPLAAAMLFPGGVALPAILILSVLLLGVLGALGAYAGGAPYGRAVVRVMLFGSLAMTVTAGVGHLFHVST